MSVALQWEKRFKSEPVEVRHIVRDILKHLGEVLPGQTPDEKWELKLIFSELLFNAVIHGNRSDANKWVHVAVDVRDRFINASVMDEGNGFDYEKIIALASREDSLYKESGRGMKIVQALTDEVAFSHEGRRVTIQKRIGHPHG